MIREERVDRTRTQKTCSYCNVGCCQTVCDYLSANTIPQIFKQTLTKFDENINQIKLETILSDNDFSPTSIANTFYNNALKQIFCISSNPYNKFDNMINYSFGQFYSQEKLNKFVETCDSIQRNDVSVEETENSRKYIREPIFKTFEIKPFIYPKHSCEPNPSVKKEVVRTTARGGSINLKGGDQIDTMLSKLFDIKNYFYSNQYTEINGKIDEIRTIYNIILPATPFAVANINPNKFNSNNFVELYSNILVEFTKIPDFYNKFSVDSQVYKSLVLTLGCAEKEYTEETFYYKLPEHSIINKDLFNKLTGLLNDYLPESEQIISKNFTEYYKEYVSNSLSTKFKKYDIHTKIGELQYKKAQKLEEDKLSKLRSSGIIRVNEKGQNVIAIDDEGREIIGYDKQGYPFYDYVDGNPKKPIYGYDSDGKPYIGIDDSGNYYLGKTTDGYPIYEYNNQLTFTDFFSSLDCRIIERYRNKNIDSSFFNMEYFNKDKDIFLISNPDYYNKKSSKTHEIIDFDKNNNPIYEYINKIGPDGQNYLPEGIEHCQFLFVQGKEAEAIECKKKYQKITKVPVYGYSSDLKPIIGYYETRIGIFPIFEYKYGVKEEGVYSPVIGYDKFNLSDEHYGQLIPIYDYVYGDNPNFIYQIHGYDEQGPYTYFMKKKVRYFDNNDDPIFAFSKYYRINNKTATFVDSDGVPFFGYNKKNGTPSHIRI